MFFYRKDNAQSTAAEARASGGATLKIQSGDASKFGTPTVDSYMRLSIFAPDGTPKGILLTSGRSGSTFTIVGPDVEAGYTNDFAVDAGDVIANVITAADLTPQAIYFNGINGIVYAGGETNSEDNPFTFSIDTDVIATRAYLATALAAKQDKLPTGGTSDKFLRGDLTWQTPPASDLSGYATTTVTNALDARLDSLEAADFATSTELTSGLNGKANASTVTTLIGRVDDIEADYVDASELTAGLATKEPSLPSGGDSTKYLRGDKTWQLTSGLTNGLATTTTTDALDGRIDALEAAPKPIVPIARWGSSATTDLSTGPLDERVVTVPVGYTITHVVVSAVENDAGGGVSLNVKVDGADLFASDISLPASTTSPTAFSSGFASSAVGSLDPLLVEVASVGSEVRGLVVELFGREAS